MPESSTEEPLDRIVELLARHEETIAKLYDDFAAAYPGSRSFWEQLAKEERAHAAWIRRLRREGRTGAVRIDPAALDPAAAQRAVDEVNDRVLSFHVKPFDEPYAVAVALKIESSIVEKRMMAPYVGISAAFRRAIEEMAKRSAAHAEKILLFYRLSN